MKITATDSFNAGDKQNMLLSQRWLWHLLFWMGYAIFRFWMYYITVAYYPNIFLEYMLLSELLFIGAVYVTLWFYRSLFPQKKYIAYFSAGTILWTLYLLGRTSFQFYYLKAEPSFRGTSFPDMFINNITVVIVCFLFITACKYFKDGYISQQFEAKKNQEQLSAELNNLKSQIAPQIILS